MSCFHVLHCPVLLLLVFFLPLQAVPSQARDPSEKSSSSNPTVKTERFGKWKGQCQYIKTREGGTRRLCHVYIEARAKATEERVLFFGIAPSIKTAGMTALMIVPLGTSLLPGIGFQIDSNNPEGGNFSVCHKIGCQAEVEISTETIQALRKGNKVTVSFVEALKKQQIALELPLKGMTTALDWLAAQ